MRIRFSTLMAVPALTLAAPATAAQPVSGASASSCSIVALESYRIGATLTACSFRVAKTTATPGANRTARQPLRRPMPAYRPAIIGPVAPPEGLLASFELDAAAMTPAAAARARTFAQALQREEFGSAKLLIAGHTDAAAGSRGASVEVSRQRAQSVADFLVAQGVDGSRLEVKGVGPAQPLPGHAPSADDNRRVEAVLLS